MTKFILLAWDKYPPLIESTKLQSGGEGLCAIDVTTGGHSCDGVLEARQVPQKLFTKFFHLRLILMVLT